MVDAAVELSDWTKQPHLHRHNNTTFQRSFVFLVYLEFPDLHWRLVHYSIQGIVVRFHFKIRSLTHMSACLDESRLLIIFGTGNFFTPQT